MKAAKDGDGAVDAAERYAEYWFGTHPNGPSFVLLDDGEIPLKDWLEANPGARGAAAASGDLPYLFKILSIAKALSIQAHPDKALAERLHAAAPSVYKDDNHKPEMCVALTPFEAMCGFRAPEEITGFLQSVPELAGLVGEAAVEAWASEAGGTGVKAALKSLFHTYMSADADAVEAATSAFTARMSSESSVEGADAIAKRLTTQFPGDIGIFAPYLLNTLSLAPGEAIFLAANEPHAYLSGDCMECMACSDNVVRAGLTPKLKDVPVLCDMLTYNTGAPVVLHGEHDGGYMRTYTPPVPEFVIKAVDLPAGAAMTLPKPPSAAVWVVVGGAGTIASPSGPTPFKEGGIWLQAADAEITIESAAESGVVAYCAHVNSS
jgi:mannose-6-phosphate isomerase